MAKLLTVREVAQELKVSPKTVYKLIKSGSLPTKLVGSRFRVREEDLLRYIEAA